MLHKEEDPSGVVYSSRRCDESVQLAMREPIIPARIILNPRRKETVEEKRSEGFEEAVRRNKMTSGRWSKKALTRRKTNKISRKRKEKK